MGLGARTGKGERLSGFLRGEFGGVGIKTLIVFLPP